MLKSSFQKENLAVNWISFNFRGKNNWKAIGTYLFESLKFNVFQKEEQSIRFEKLF